MSLPVLHLLKYVKSDKPYFWQKHVTDAEHTTQLFHSHFLGLPGLVCSTQRSLSKPLEINNNNNIDNVYGAVKACHHEKVI